VHRGLSDQLIFEIKDLTCNAQFNFCFHRPFRIRLSRAAGLKRLPRVCRDDSRTKLSKISVLPTSERRKKLNLVPGLVSRSSSHLSTSSLRPQFKLGTKLSQFEVPEVEELHALTSEPTCVRDVHLSARAPVVNEVFKLFSSSQTPLSDFRKQAGGTLMTDRPRVN
jgi:hypothetical protein